jgi:PAS domain S-box-containing protein
VANNLSRVRLGADENSVEGVSIMGTSARPAILISNLETHAFETAETPMWVYDVKSLAFVAVNEAAVRLYGYSREEFLAKTILDIRPTEDVIPVLRETLGAARHESEKERWRHRTKSGKVVDVLISSREVIFNGRASEIVVAEIVAER